MVRSVQPEDANFPLVQGCIQNLERVGAQLSYTSQNLGEFWNVLTRPKDRNGYGLIPEQANRRASQIESQFRLLPDTPEVHRVWRKLLIDYRISGVQVHDARLVAAMLVHGVPRILTFNTRDFQRFDGIDAVHPAALA